LAGDKRVIIALARGGIYSEGSPTAAFEFVERYLRAAFNFLGIEPVFVVAEGLAISPELREQSIGQALGETIRLAA
jgi:FMN-dependent NADH-azoreductase